MGLEMIDAGWLSILPPLIAITLALISKEVYSSLFLGILSGMCVYCFSTGGNLLQAVTCVFDMMALKIGENGYMIIFLVLLGSLVVIVTRSGGSDAYGQWAGKRIRKTVSAKLATALLGLLIFVDDGFNCLTVGTVMRPITDKCRISREKLAYLLDATAAPVCIIAPISSWAVAVASEVEEAGGLNAFVRTIPYNLYAILTIIMVFFLSATDFDFGPMQKAERGRRGERLPVPEAGMGSADEAGARSEADVKPGKREKKKGSVPDLILPVLTLIVCAILGMAYVGGYFEGRPFTEAIGENPTAGLTLGTFAALVVAMALYIPRRIMSLRQFMTGVIDGIKTMIPALTILILAWALGGVCREMIGTGIFVSNFVTAVNLPYSFLPAIVFLVAAFLSFSMGTAWGTFGILLPIVSMLCVGNAGAAVLIPALGATLAGSVYGDHCSPISDTTILASTGAQCDHLSHVETQLPYATLVAAVCFAGYLVAGFSRNPWITVAVSVALLFGVLGGIVLWQKRDRSL
ncbi:MAG: Na+/H+ antiporter NhaC family protein [Lachnospiraceae bacterium]|nr:Na+/H+ antiporter NhaC family protein [Butyrivibrio sp.]MCM1342888.1 Na+/H+ antiporter NhaC family protein [Muribaculaceae bacterium]MCM1411655.1 Na+/H+ antiporter NhaC family protein [Lachnospiraceae bacterium]